MFNSVLSLIWLHLSPCVNVCFVDSESHWTPDMGSDCSVSSSVTGEPSFTTLNCLDLAIWSLLKHTPPFSSHRSTTSPLSNPFHFSLLRRPMRSFHVCLLLAFQPVSLSFGVFQQDHVYKHSPSVHYANEMA